MKTLPRVTFVVKFIDVRLSRNRIARYDGSTYQQLRIIEDYNIIVEMNTKYVSLRKRHLYVK